jgi:hypothetical protein
MNNSNSLDILVMINVIMGCILKSQVSVNEVIPFFDRYELHGTSSAYYLDMINKGEHLTKHG